MKKSIVGLVFLCLAFSSAWGPRAAAQAPPTPPEELPAGAEVLNRGPVNEAFAEPVATQDQAGLVVPRQPPDNIEEVPPAERPMGNDYTWVPGYWSWDSDRDDFIWVGACWRAAPPKMHWIPGYWAEGSDGWEWVAGFWASDKSREIDYLPAPPSPEELQAPGSPPDPDDLWVPGCWYWVRNQYVYRPGYWLPQRPDWVWVPSHYSWSPRGFIFIAGYWDLAFDARGVVFAPIYFPPSVYGRPGFSFSPGVVIDLGAISISLFAYPSYSHYFFGDYYDDSYVRRGIYPWFDCDRLHTWYDPIYQHDRWRFRHSDPHWDEHQHQDYDRYRSDRAARPPRTYRELQTRVGGMPEPQRRGVEFVRPLQTVVTDTSTRVRFEQMAPDARQRIAKSGSDVHKYRQERRTWEAPPAVAQPTPPSRENRGPNVSHQQAPPAPARHQVRATRAERVKVPPPPTVVRERGTPKEAAPAPPPAPKGERKTQTAKQARQARPQPRDRLRGR
jgi:hypothetical protein